MKWVNTLRRAQSTRSPTLFVQVAEILEREVGRPDVASAAYIEAARTYVADPDGFSSLCEMIERAAAVLERHGFDSSGVRCGTGIRLIIEHDAVMGTSQELRSLHLDLQA